MYPGLHAVDDVCRGACQHCHWLTTLTTAGLMLGMMPGAVLAGAEPDRRSSAARCRWSPPLQVIEAIAGAVRRAVPPPLIASAGLIDTPLPLMCGASSPSCVRAFFPGAAEAYSAHYED